MRYEKRKVIQSIVDSAITAFATGLLSGYEFEDNCDYCFVSTAKNNPFTAEFGDEFMFRSPFAHSFVNVLAYMGNCIAKLSYEVRGDNHLYSPQKNEHYLIELKASGDLDNKKARAEKSALLDEYFLLRNQLKDDPSAKIKIFYASIFDDFCEFSSLGRERNRQFFADDEWLSGKDYWNFVCDDEGGFDVVFGQYKESCNKIKNDITRIREASFCQ